MSTEFNNALETEESLFPNYLLRATGLHRGSEIPNCAFKQLDRMNTKFGQAYISSKIVESMRAMIAPSSYRFFKVKEPDETIGYFIMAQGAKGLTVHGFDEKERFFSNNVSSSSIFAFWYGYMNVKDELAMMEVMNGFTASQCQWPDGSDGPYLDTNLKETLLTISGYVYGDLSSRKKNDSIPYFRFSSAEDFLNELTPLENLTPFIRWDVNDKKTQEGYNIPDKYSFSAKYNAVPVKAPTKKMELEKHAEEMAKARKPRPGIKEFIKMQEEGKFNVFTDEELSKLPLALQYAAIKAKDMFNKGKEFLTLRDWQRIAMLANGMADQITCSGPTGSGKTTLIWEYAGALNMPLVVVGGANDIDTAALFGFNSLVQNPNGEGTIIKWQDGPATQAIRYGAFLLFDEMNAASGGIIMKFNSVLDGSKSITLDSSEVVQVDKKFRFAAAYNVGAGYEGTGDVNKSNVNRMNLVFIVPNKTVKEMIPIVEKFTNYHNKTHLRKMCQVIFNINERVAAGEGDFHMAVSIRQVENWVEAAFISGEFINSACETVIGPMAIYTPDNIRDYTPEAIAADQDGFIASVFDEIKSVFKDEIFDDVSYNGMGAGIF